MLRQIFLVPLFNILIVIYALLPGHNLGLAIIVFTFLIRLVLWPLLRKQIHQQKAMRELQPELKKIKKKAKGDRQKEAQLTMELYKERELNPFSSIGTALLQLPIFIGLFYMLRGIFNAIADGRLVELFNQDLYGFVADIPFVADLVNNIASFDTTLFGLIDLSQGSVILAATAATGQFFQASVLRTNSDDSKKLRDILKDAADGKQPNQQEQTAAMARSAGKILPAFTFIISLNLPSALALYWTVNALVAGVQQKLALGHEVALLTRRSSNGNGEES